MRNFVLGIILGALLLSSCGEYNKVLKSSDSVFKYKKAVEYYEAGDYVKSGTILQDLVSIFRGTSRAAEIYYYYAKSMVGQKDYLMAGHYFKTLVKEFPGSEYAEESYFMVGYCSYILSPNARLDQTITHEAIDALQLYINLYPYSDKVDEANRLIDDLNNKLEYKSYLNAKLYYDFENYKAAVVALTNSLNKYPDSKYREDIMYMLLKSKYLLAMNSVIGKKQERLSNALDEYFNFVDAYPNSKYIKEVEKFHKTASELLNYKEEETNNN